MQTRGPAAASALDANTWVQHDRNPGLPVVVPELSEPPLSYEEKLFYPPALREWWRRGYVRAMVIASHGTRTRHEAWQLGNILGSRISCLHLINVIRWAIEAEMLKVKASMMCIQRHTEEHSRWVVEGGKMKLEVAFPSKSREKKATKKIKKPKNFMWL